MIDRIYLSIDRKCDKNLGYNLPGSIAARSMLDLSNLIFDRLKIVRKFFKTKIFSCVLLFIQTFQKLLSSLLRPIHLKSFFCHFLPNFSQGFCLQVLVRPFYPFFFILFTYFMHFKGTFQTYRNLGFLIFELVSFKIDHWFFFF